MDLIWIYIVPQAFCDLEPIYTYEGTYEINSLVTGREITGIASFKPAVSRSRMWLCTGDADNSHGLHL